MKPALSIALFAAALPCLLAAGCSPVNSQPLSQSCEVDDECPSGQVCFADGCGSPERDLAVLVTLSPNNIQDFPVLDLKGRQNIQLFPPSIVFGDFTRFTASGPMPYGKAVTLVMRGESTVIPGEGRSHTERFTTAGSYSFEAPSGHYTVTATPADYTVPPLEQDVLLMPGDARALHWTFPPPEALVQLQGQLLRTIALGPVSVPMAVQALDPGSRKALSQWAPVQSSGAFTLTTLRPERSDSVIVQAMPLQSQALVPHKTFSVQLPSSSPVLLELGNFQEPVRVTGRARGSNDVGIAGATVYFSGRVPGGASFTSPSKVTAADGTFDMMTLPGGTALGEYELWAVPPPGLPSGTLHASVIVPPAGGALGNFECPDRVPVRGEVLRPDGRAFAGVRVHAKAVDVVEGYARPDGEPETVTDEDGKYLLYMEPAVYRLDFFPLENLPRMSRFLTLRRDIDLLGGVASVELPTYTVSKGRTLEGMVTAFPTRLATEQVPAPYVGVSFFRRVTSEGKPVAMQLAETTSDVTASYQVVLPTR